jgi:hypothetical protein
VRMLRDSVPKNALGVQLNDEFMIAAGRSVRSLAAAVAKGVRHRCSIRGEGSIGTIAHGVGMCRLA